MSSHVTVEQKIQDKYQCTVIELFKGCVEEGLSSAEVAEKLECSVSNLRRIARKYEFSFSQPPKPELASASERFQDHGINEMNFLSRAWHCEEAEA